MTMQNREKYMTQNYQPNVQNIMSKGDGLGVGASQSRDLSRSIKNHLNQNQNVISETGKKQGLQQSQLTASTEKSISKGENYGKKGIAHHMLDGVKDLL